MTALPTHDFLVNGRYRGRQTTGVERYAQEVLRHFRSTPSVISPASPLTGIKGHMWEQTILPLHTSGRLLWSPCNIGPLLVSNQVLSLHDIIVLDRPDWFQASFVRLYAGILPRLLRNVRHVLTGSIYSKQRILERFHLSDDKVSVTPYGVSEEFTRRPDDEVARVRQLYQVPDRPYVLMLSSREPRKNHVNVLRAWQNVTSRRDDACLVIAGGHGQSQNFRSIAALESVPLVIQTGYVPNQDLPALYSGAAAFAFPSLYEGFGLPVLEALACGTPVITSNTTSLPELRGGKMLFVDPLDCDEIANAMMELLEDTVSREQVAQVCQRHARLFSWSQTAARTEEILLQYC